MLHPCELCQSIDVCILKPFGGGVGRCDSQSLGTCYGTDYSDMSVFCLFEIIESCGYHSDKAFDIGTCGIQFYFRFQVPVLKTYAGAEEK